MKASEAAWNTFYQKLGYLFYSVAKADRTINEKEIDALHEMVKKEWLHLESTHDAFGTDAAFQIEIVFDWIRDNDIKAEKAFHAFEQYYKENPSMFDDEVVSKIVKTCKAIAVSFHGNNKAELASLHRMHALLGTISAGVQ